MHTVGLDDPEVRIIAGSWRDHHLFRRITRLLESLFGSGILFTVKSRSSRRGGGGGINVVS